MKNELKHAAIQDGRHVRIKMDSNFSMSAFIGKLSVMDIINLIWSQKL